MDCDWVVSGPKQIVTTVQSNSILHSHNTHYINPYHNILRFRPHFQFFAKFFISSSTTLCPFEGRESKELKRGLLNWGFPSLPWRLDLHTLASFSWYVTLFCISLFVGRLYSLMFSTLFLLIWLMSYVYLMSSWIL